MLRGDDMLTLIGAVFGRERFAVDLIVLPHLCHPGVPLGVLKSGRQIRA